MIETGDPVGVILFGLGALGSLVLDCLRTGYPLIRVVGAVDHAPDKVGRRLADLYPALADAGEIEVHASLRECLAATGGRAQLLYHLTESELTRIEDQLTEALTAGLDVISASEAMFHPVLRHASVASRLDAAGKAAGATITGVGINPGYSFDSLPLLLARSTCGVTRVTISRAIDVTGTGPGDIDHVGYGLRPDAFDEGIACGRIVGHMGMPESIAAVAERLALEIDRVEEAWTTQVSDVPVESGTPSLGIIEPGRVVGITQTGTGLRGPVPVVTMRLAMYYRPERFGVEAIDTIDIEGLHRIRANIRPAALSLLGAASAIVNATQDVRAAPPGLFDILGAGIAGARRGGFRYELDPAIPPRPGMVALRKAPV